MDDNRLKKAIALAQTATDLDKEGKYEEALDYYKLSLDNWNLVCKWQNVPALKERLCLKMEEYITRAEQIKQYLEKRASNLSSPGSNQVVSSGGEGTAQQDPAQKDQSDQSAEHSRLKASVASTIIVQNPNVRWDDVAGLEQAKSSLKEAVVLPTRFPSLFTAERKPWTGILLYGPPGTGKTFLAKACATQANASFLSVSSADLVSKWQGESEKLVRALFEIARDKAPSIIFVDEVDSMCRSRGEGESESSRRIKTEFLVQMDGIGQPSDFKGNGNSPKSLLVLGATNVPWELDAAIRRRFERRIYIPLPDERARKQLFSLHIGKTPHTLTDKDLNSLAKRTQGFSGADIAVMVRDALFEPLRKCEVATHFKRVRDPISAKVVWTPCPPGDPDPTKEERDLMSIPGDALLPPKLAVRDFETVIDSAKPSVGPTELSKHMAWTKDFGLQGA